jgi:hypothetical protein
MANLVNGAVFRFAAEVTVAALDNNNVQQERTKIFEFNPGVVLYADALAALANLQTRLQAVSEDDIIRNRLVTIFDTTTGDVTTVGNVRKEAILSLRVDGSSTKKVNHTIFSPADANISGNAVVIDADMQAYLDLFETGGDFALSDGEFISTAEATRVAASRIRHVPGPRTA